MDKVVIGLFFGLLCIAIALVFSLILAFPTMLLWNWLMPVIFGLKEITFLQSMGLLALSSLLLTRGSVSTK